MRSLLLSVVLGVGAIGLFAAMPAQARADGWHGRGYGYGRGYGGGYYNRGYYNRGFDDRGFYNRGYYGGYPYGGFGGYGRGYGGYGGYGVGNFYAPRLYGVGFYPWGDR